MLTTILSAPPAPTPPPLDLYITPSGSDSGGSGSAGNPWATITGALAGITAGGFRNAGRDLRVNVAAGTYRGTTSFASADSALDANRIKFIGAGTPGSVILRSSVVVTGWTLHSGSIYRAFVGAATPFYTLWEDGVRAREARFPKYVASATYPSARATYTTSIGAPASHTALWYGAGTLGADPVSWDLAAYEPRIVIWSGETFDWFQDTVPIDTMIPGDRTINLAQDTRYEIGSGSRFFAQGDLSMLTEAGEWAYNRQTGYLYYWPVGAIGSVTIEIPTAQRTVSFVGTSEANPVRNISLEGISIEQSDFTDWYRHAYVNDGDSGEGHTWPGYDRQMTLPGCRQGLVYLENAVGIELSRCRLKNAGMHALYGYGLNQQHVFRDILAQYVGHSAAYIDGKYPGEGDVSFGNTFYNWKAHDVGQLVGNGAGIVLVNSGGNWVRNVEIYNAPRWALAVMAYTGITPSQIYARGNLITHGKLHDMNLDSGDSGAIYCFGFSSTAPPYCSNQFDQHTIDDSHADPSMVNLAPGAVYFDNETAGQTLSNINATNIQGSDYQAVEGGHTVTNVSWGVFNAALMEETGVTAGFPVFA